MKIQSQSEPLSLTLFRSNLNVSLLSKRSDTLSVSFSVRESGLNTNTAVPFRPMPIKLLKMQIRRYTSNAAYISRLS